MHPVTDRQENPLQRTAELLERGRSGDAQARDELFERYGPPLESFLHGRLPPASHSLLETQDLVQEVRLRAFQCLDGFECRGIGSFWGYLRRIALNYLGDVYRRSELRGHEQALPESSSVALQAPGAEVVQEVFGREQCERFEGALHDLAPTVREALLMRIELDLAYEVIAQECGYPSPDSARMAIRRALEQVARRMGTDGA